MSQRDKCVYGGKEYSDGSKICMGGTKHRCVNGEWDDLGEKCNDRFSSHEDLETLLSDLPIADDDVDVDVDVDVEVNESENVTEYTIYADRFDIQDIGRGRLRIKGGQTEGEACVGDDLLIYEIPKQNIIHMSVPEQCEHPNVTTRIREIIYKG